MRKLLYIILIFVVSLFCGCNDFMEFPPAATFNEDSVYSKYTNVERLVYDMYNRPVPLNIDTRDFGADGTRFGGGSFASAVTDEGQALHIQSGYQVQQYYKGNVDASFSASWSSSFHGEDDYAVKWKTIRKAYKLLENVDRVPDATVEQKERIKGEAKLMIATVYFEMFKRYGGVPIVTKAFAGTESTSETSLPRATLQDTYQFILDLLDDVINNYSEYIPANYTELPDEFGRFPLAFAYGLKARFLLYAASPLYNTSKPYSDALGENSNLICFMNYDRERWRLAAEAADEAIKYCLNNGYRLVDDESQRDNAMNYTVANIEYPSKGNTEVIWGTLQNNPGGQINNLQSYTLIRGIPGGVYGYACNMVPLNQVERYEKKTGIPGEYDSWEHQKSYLTNIQDTDSPADAKLKLAKAARRAYEGLDPRFYASIAYNGIEDYGNWGLSGDIDMADAYTDDGVNLSGLNGQNSTSRQNTTILHFVRKFTRNYEGSERYMKPINIYMRMAELYLIRAEALNNYSGPSQRVYDDMNIIRRRSGMCDVKKTTDVNEMNEIIAHERNIELYYEDHRWFDLRRTLKAEEYIPVMIYRVNIRKWYKTAESKYPYKITYDKEPYEKRYWSNHWYMNPFPKNEVNKFYGLIQNPGW